MFYLDAPSAPTLDGDAQDNLLGQIFVGWERLPDDTYVVHNLDWHRLAAAIHRRKHYGKSRAWCEAWRFCMWAQEHGAPNLYYKEARGGDKSNADRA